MEAFVADFKDASGCLARIDITAGTGPTLIQQLRGSGFAESMIFPDLEGLARELKATEGF